jgi:hypothetical protein
VYMNLAAEPAYNMPFISDRIAYACAFDLVDQEGDDAVMTAAERADHHVALGDEPMAAYWVRVERAIQILLLQDVVGEIH